MWSILHRLTTCPTVGITTVLGQYRSHPQQRAQCHWQPGVGTQHTYRSAVTEQAVWHTSYSWCHPHEMHTIRILCTVTTSPTVAMPHAEPITTHIASTDPGVVTSCCTSMQAKSVKRTVSRYHYCPSNDGFGSNQRNAVATQSCRHSST